MTFVLVFNQVVWVLWTALALVGASLVLFGAMYYWSNAKSFFGIPRAVLILDEHSRSSVFGRHKEWKEKVVITVIAAAVGTTVGVLIKNYLFSDK